MVTGLTREVFDALSGAVSRQSSGALQISTLQAQRRLGDIGIRDISDVRRLTRLFIAGALPEEREPSKLSESQRRLLELKQKKIAEVTKIGRGQVTTRGKTPQQIREEFFEKVTKGAGDRRKLPEAFLRGRVDPRISIKPERLISPVTPETFKGKKVEIPLTIKIRQAIARLPGGATILRNIRAGTETLKDIEKRFPVIEDVTRTERSRLEKTPSGFVREDIRKLFTPSGRGTEIVVPKIREQTFEERLGIKEDKDSAILKSKAEKIQEDIINGKINEEQANVRLDDALNSFVTKKAVKNIPRNFAIGLGLTAIQAVPILGQVVATGFLGNAILRRRQLVGQFKKFPKASAINTASFLAGGLTGSVIKSGISGRFNSKIDPESIKSVTIIGGKQKTKLVKQVQQVNPDFRIALKDQKVTGTIAYEIATKDGRTYRIVEFNKLSPGDLAKGLRGRKNFIGFQTNIARGETVVGKGVSVVTNGKTESFLRVVRFKPSGSAQGRALQLFGIKKARVIDILEKSKVVKQKGKTAQIISEARILNIKNANKALSREIVRFDLKLKTLTKLGRKVNPNEIKTLINLERRANGLKPFTETEFRQAGTPVITTSFLQSVLKKARGSLTKNENLIRLAIKTKEDVVGTAFAAPKVEPFVVKKVPKGKPITLTDFSKQVRELSNRAKGATSAQLKTIAKQITNLKGRLTQTPGSITLALANKLERPAIIPGAVPGVLVPSAFAFQAGGIFSGRPLTAAEVAELNFVPSGGEFTIKQNRIVNQLPLLELRIKTSQQSIQKLKLELKNKQKLKVNQRSITLTNQSISNAQRQIQQLKQVQKLALKLKQRQRAIQKRTGVALARPPLVTPLGLPIPLIAEEEGVPGRKKKKPEKPIPISKLGYNVLGKPIKKKKLRKLNKVPLTEKKAKDLGAWLIDHSLARTFKLERAKKLAKKPKLRVPKDYFAKTKIKYRNFRIAKGKKVPIKNTWIEKSGRLKKGQNFLLDTRAERKRITLLRQLANLRKKSFKPVKSNMKSTSKIKKGRKPKGGKKKK